MPPYTVSPTDWRFGWKVRHWLSTVSGRPLTVNKRCPEWAWTKAVEVLLTIPSGLPQYIQDYITQAHTPFTHTLAHMHRERYAHKLGYSKDFPPYWPPPPLLLVSLRSSPWQGRWRCQCGSQSAVSPVQQTGLTPGGQPAEHSTLISTRAHDHTLDHIFGSSTQSQKCSWYWLVVGTNLRSHSNVITFESYTISIVIQLMMEEWRKCMLNDFKWCTLTVC